MALLMKRPLTIVILSEMITGCVGGVCDSVCNEVRFCCDVSLRQRLGRN
jgi:hypothetical protein